MPYLSWIWQSGELYPPVSCRCLANLGYNTFDYSKTVTLAKKIIEKNINQTYSKTVMDVMHNHLITSFCDVCSFGYKPAVVKSSWDYLMLLIKEDSYSNHCHIQEELNFWDLSSGSILCCWPKWWKVPVVPSRVPRGDASAKETTYVLHTIKECKSKLKDKVRRGRIVKNSKLQKRTLFFSSPYLSMFMTLGTRLEVWML